MKHIGKFLNRCNWQFRHTAASCLTVLEEALVHVENITARERDRLIILDDFFPLLATAFRVAEINTILKRFPTAIAYSSWPTRQGFRSYAAAYPELTYRVRRFYPRRHLKGSAAYVIFLHNAFDYVETIEKAELPFAFELYPGAGFRLDEPASDARLERVFSSPKFRKTIVTQNVTRDYLLHKRFCRADQIEFIFGVVAPSETLKPPTASRLRFGLDKKTLDICFIANKYMTGGLDKGFDRFIASARILAKYRPESRFHVVGNFTGDDADAGDLRNKITFHGHQTTPFFPEFHSRMDLILSPNVPFTFAPGAFDGFPTGCCIEAALCGTAIFATDELGMNEGRLKDGEEIVIIPREPEAIAEKIGAFIADPPRLASLAQNGERAVRNLFSLKAQMTPRLSVLSDLLANAPQTSM